MTVGYVLAIKRLYGAGIVRVAAKHNLREIAAELGADGHIDAARIADNFTLRGPATADGVAQLAKSLMESAGVTKCRKTAVMALELLFTLPAAAAIDPRQYFEQATTWAEQHFGVPVLSCVVHLDEGAPHAHALLLPLVDGRMGGSDLHGGKAKLWAMQTDFHTRVGAQYGFARQAPTKRHSMTARAAGMAMLRDCFQTNTAMSDAAINVLLKPHAKDPEPLLVALGFAMPAPKAHAKGSFVAMMTAPCKPEPRNPIGKARRNPIGKAVLGAAPESQPYTCVGIAFTTAPISTVEHHVDTPAKRSTAKGIVPADDTRAVQPAVDAVAPARQHMASIEQVTPRNAKVSHAVPARRAKTSTATPASALTGLRAGKRKSTASRPTATPSMPSNSTRSTSSTAAPSTSTPKPKRTATLQQQARRMATSSKPALGKGQYDADADQPDEIRRLADDEQGAARCERSTNPAVSSSAEPGKSWFDIGANQPNEIRTLGLAACISISSASHSAETSAQCSWPKFSGQQHSPEYSGQLQVNQQASLRAGEDDRHGTPALDWPPMAALRINDSATARQPAPAGIAAHARHQSPTPVIEQGPLQGGALTVVQLRPLEGEQVQRYVDRYQRLRDDEHAAELWDSERGEFVTALARPARSASTMHHIDAQYADDQGAVWFDAKPTAIEAALDSIRAVHGQH